MALLAESVSTTGTGAIALSAPAANDLRRLRLRYLQVKISSAPTTAESATVTKNDAEGATYDTVLFSVDPSVEGATSIFWLPNKDIDIEKEDTLDFAYPNSDGNTVTAKFVYQAV